MPNFSIEEIRRIYEEKRRKRQLPGNPTRSVTQEQLEYGHDSGSYRPPTRPSSDNTPTVSWGEQILRRNSLRAEQDAAAQDRSRIITAEQLEYAHDSNAYRPPTTHSKGRQSHNQNGSSDDQPLYTLGERIHRRNNQREWLDEQAKEPKQQSRNEDDTPDYAEYEPSEFISEAAVNIPVTADQRQHLEVLIGVESNDNVRGVLIAFLHEGIPRERFTEYYLSQFMHWGDDPEADAYALELLERVRYSYWDESLSQEDLADDLWVQAHASHSMMWEDGIVSEEEQASYDGSFEDYKEHVELIYGVKFTSEEGADEWNLLDVRMVHIELENVARISGDRLRGMTDLSMNDATAFRLIFGDITLHQSAKTRVTGEGHPVAAEVSGHNITIYRKEGHNRNYHLEPYLFLHELGHVFNAHAGQGNPLGYGTITRVIADHTDTETRAGMGWPREDILLNDSLAPTKHTDDMHRLIPLHEYLELEPDDPLITTTGLKSMYVQLLQQSRDYSNNEIAADTYLNYIVHLTTRGQLGFSPDAAGQERLNFMNDNMDKWIRNAIFYNAADDPHVKRFLEERGVLLPDVGTGIVDTNNNEGAILRSGPSEDAEFVKYLAENSAVTLLARTQYVDDKGFHWNAIEDSGVYWTRYDLVTENWDDDIPYLSRDEVSATFNPGRPYEETAGWFREFVRYLLTRR
ncbi:MAG: hypothetical protein OXG60_17260 [Chloroflexi bacterium]|nr:hypothetical protein [Chloroflexota bacterium]